MKNKFKCIVILFVILFGILGTYNTAFASGNLDEIQSYNIVVDMRDDGTLDMYYDISWKVLDSKSQGPLEWVFIGIPNKHIDEIKKESANIKDIKYEEEDGQTSVRIDLDREYHAGEIVDFSFSFHQDYMYQMNTNDKTATYVYTPGWFNSIDVKNITVKWNSKNVIEATSDNADRISDDGYFVWKSSLTKGQKLTIKLTYNLNDYAFNESKQATDGESSEWGGIIIGLIIGGIVLIGVIAIFSDDDDYHGGFGGSSGGIRSTHVSSCARSSCACACACACAGGGRAGCSLKDFYHTGLKTNKIKDAIEKKK